MATGYNYQPLSAARGEIRLLSLEEKQFRSRGRLECQLHHVSLYDAVQIPEYFAISYAWGHGTITRRDMLIDGEVVSVPESADDALRHTCRQSDVPYAEADGDAKRGWAADDDGTKMVMWSGTSGERRARHPDKMPEIHPSRNFWTGWAAAPIRRYIWIDAICINQADLEERSQQVKLMGVVYRMAKRVLVWLGQEDALTKAAIESIYVLYRQAWEATDGLKDLYGMVFGERNGWTLTQRSELPLPDNCNWAALCEFYSARWFERLWIVQEVTLAHRSICYRGSYIVDGQAMFVAATWMRYRGYEDERYCGRPINGIDSAALLCDYLEAGEQSLFSLLDASMRSKSSDPKDKVFGMLGLMSSEVSESLNPDYLRSLKEIYAEATVACIRERKKPCILSLAQAVVPPEKSQGPDDWPSWVPHYDWILDTMEGSYLPFPSRGENGACRPREAQELESLYNPANSEGQNLSYDNFMAAMSKAEQATERTANVRDLNVSDDWSLLHLKGVIFDTVESVGTPNRWPRDKSWNSLALDLLDDFRMFVASAKRASGTDDDQSFTQAWTNQLSPAGSDSPVVIESSPYLISNEELAKSASAFTRWCHAMIEKTIHNWSKSEIQENSLAGMAFLSAVRAHGTNRKMFRTRKGNLGIASHGVEKSDRICILFGGNVPFALREEGKYWRLISDASVANIMNGEYIRELQDRNWLFRDKLESETREFILH